MSRKIQVKRGNAANLPTLSPGEIGLALDTDTPYIGGNIENIQIATKAYVQGQIAAHNSSNENVHPYILQSVTGQLNAHNASTAAHADIRQELENLAAAIRALGGDV